MYGCFACISVYHLHAWCLRRPKDSIDHAPQLELQRVVSHHVGARNSGPLEKEPALLAAEPSLQPKPLVLAPTT